MILLVIKVEALSAVLVGTVAMWLSAATNEAIDNATLIILALIAAIPPTLAAIAALVVGLLTRGTVKKNQRDILALDIKVDGKIERLLQTTERLATAEGHATGVTDERVRAEQVTADIVAAEQGRADVREDRRDALDARDEQKS